ncbi:MAG: metallopeptidase [Desulfurococcales archaeon]|nr:metallopeptidase [Desulfurococcales archaeon]
MPRVRYERADDVCEAIKLILSMGLLPHIDPSRIHCVRSRGSSTRVVARIYGLPRPWIVAGLEPGYVIEVVSERFDSLDCRGKLKTLLHELLHIPKTFSGALRPHGRYVNSRVVGALYRRVRGLEGEVCRALSGRRG